jgi:hypothetical protein
MFVFDVVEVAAVVVDDALSDVFVPLLSTVFASVLS